MIKIKKSIIYILLLVFIALPLVSCSTQNSIINIKPQEFKTAESTVIDTNDRYTLSWDAVKNSALLKNNDDSGIWSTVPYDFYLTDETNVNLNAPMFITYYNTADGSLMSAKAFSDCIELGNFSVEAEEAKIRMEFYFEDAEILIPLEISLNENGMRASIRAAEIKESGKTMLIDVSVLPYLCSAPNVSDKSNYLFVPTGSGALLYTDEEIQEFSRSYTGEVYGTDKAKNILDNTTDEEPIRLPVFGAKKGDSALFAIISEGEGAAKITADSGNSRNGYSTTYVTFSIRGNDETEVERTSFTDALIYSPEYDNEAVYTVDYYPLTGEKANYVGMAELYREYLKKNSMFNENEPDQKTYHLTFLGGSLVRDVAVGIPYKRMQVATTFENAKDIIEEVSKKVGSEPSVLLKGYCGDGLDIGRIGGGYSFSPKLGGKKAYKKLNEYCIEKGIPLFTEYDLVHFNSSANGFSTSFDIAKTAGKQLAAFYPLRINIRSKNEDLKKTGLLKRSLLSEAVEKLLKKNDYVSGFSLSTLGNMAYSDYSDKEYYVKNNTASQSIKLLKKVKTEKHLINVSAANGYAAQIADSVTDTPLNNGKYFAFDESVPFYQMIFRGNTALYSTPINLSENYIDILLSAVEYGVSPSFVLSDTADIALADTQSGEYYPSVYYGNKEEIHRILNITSDYFNEIGTASIVNHSKAKEKLSVTEFSNGIKVWVNRNKNREKIKGTVLEGMSFGYEKDGKFLSFSIVGGEG